MTYLNPVHLSSCPDPFVLKHAGVYWCYSTGFQDDGKAFGVSRSLDLVHWQDVGGALERLPVGTLAVPDTCYWAPEATYDNGRFYLYYSVGNEEQMQIRVAVATHPAGPFVDQGHRLTQEPFAIDAHVFTDDDGARYLFYATDDLTHDRIGTGTVMDRLVEWGALAGQPRPVTRARFDWQIYDPQRESKGGVRWHTLEGPFVLKHHGRYFQLFSGGNWQNDTYGVAYGVIDDLESLGEWEQVCDGERILPILRSRPADGIVGPGHNSVVRGPDNRELYCVYHRWALDTRRRVLAIDRLDWEDGCPVVRGPSSTEQPGPAKPLIAGFEAFDLGVCGATIDADQLVLSPRDGDCVVRLALPAGRFTMEVSLWALGGGTTGRMGVTVRGSGHDLLELALEGGSARLTAGSQLELPLPADFDPGSLHLIRFDVDGRKAAISIDDHCARATVELATSVDELRFFAGGARAAFAGFALTV